MTDNPKNRVCTVTEADQERLAECTAKVRGFMYLVATAVTNVNLGPVNDAHPEENEGINWLAFSLGQDLSAAIEAAFSAP